MKKLYHPKGPLIWLFLVIFINAYSQTGPGGVGDNTSNILWLDANKITGLADGADITTWSDVSGNGNDVSQPNASFKPIYKTSIVNGYPVVRFNKANGRIRRNPFAGFATAAITAIYVNINNGESGDGVLSYASSSSHNDFLLFGSNSLQPHRPGSINSGINFSDNQWHISNTSWRSAGGNVEVWKDGTRGFNNTLNAGSSITSGGSFAIAGEQDAIDGSYSSAQAHFGDFSEVLIFNTYLNEAQHIIVSNYLAAKYNITISNDYFAYQATHSYEVAGLGRENATNTHTAAMSADILQVENASSLDTDGDYLLFGHDNTDATTTWTTTEAPDGGTNIQRLAREWRLDETGDVGTVDFIVDTASFPALPVGHTMYALMIDSDGDFSNGASVYEMTLSAGTEYTVTGINIVDGDYIAIAAVQPTIQHTLATSNGLEDTSPTIEVSINFIPLSAKTVTYTSSDGSAIAGSDYTATGATVLTILAGTTSSTYGVTVTDDPAVESNETFDVTLSSPSVGLSLGANTVHTYSIYDNDGNKKASFSVATDSGNETETTHNVTINLTLTNPDGTGAVDYTVTGGTAIGAGTDYTLASGIANFDGAGNASFNLSIVGDALYENPISETIIITLSNPVNCNLSAVDPIDFTYTINDDDANPTIQFNTISSTGDEAVSSVNFQVDLDIVSGEDTSVTYTVTGTATGSGVDYTLADGTITIAAGSLTANISALISDDTEVELDETITITLSAPVNGVLGGNTTHTYTITDTDSFGYIGPGGVGNSTSNVLWLDADLISGRSDGDRIDDAIGWGDSSGNSNDVTQLTTGLSPSYETNELNGFPIVRFDAEGAGGDGDGRRIRKTGFTDFPTTAITAIYVNKNNGESNDGILSYASSASNNDFLLFGSSSLSPHRPGSTNSGVDFSDNNWHISSTGWRSSDGDLEVWKDGLNLYDVSRFAGTSITAGGSLAIAGEQDSVDGNYDVGQAHFGDFSEIIIYNVHLNTAQQIIVNNYLSAKYNIAISNDFYNEDDAGDFDFDVAGIGQATDGSLHIDAKGPEIIRMNTPSSLGNDEYLFWGRNNQTAYTFSTSANYTERLSSNWRVSKRGDLGTVTVDVDMTGIDITGVTACSPLQLVVDNNSDLASPTNTYELVDQGGGIYRATAVSFTDNDYFTIEYVTTIVVDNTRFYNGSGTSNVPDITDGECKLLVKGTASGVAATGGIRLTENAVVKSLEVEAGGVLGVDTGVSFTVTNAVNNTGEIRLVGTSQLLQTHAGVTQVSGTGNLFRDQKGILTNVYQSGYWTSPVTTNGTTFTIDGVFKDGSVTLTSPATAGEALDITFTDIHTLDGDDTTTPITISGRWLAKLVNATDWTRQISPTAITFNPGEGWNIKSTGAATGQNYTFKGIANDGTYTTTLDVGSLSLLGNPYPSAINADTFIADNSTSTTGVLYFYEAGNDISHVRGEYTGGYATRESGLGTPSPSAGALTPGQFIPVGQAFFVTREAAQVSNTVTFQNSQRAFQTRGASSVFFSRNSSLTSTALEVESVLPVMRIGFEFDVEGTLFHRYLAVAFREGSSNNYEVGLDAEMFDRRPSDLVLSVADKTSPFVITGENEFTETMEIPLQLFLDTERTVTFLLDGLENINIPVYVYDNVTELTYDILENPVSLTLPAGEYLNRFSIIFMNRTELKSLGVDNDSFGKGFLTYYDNLSQKIVVKSLANDEIKKVKILTILGQEIGSFKNTNSDKSEFKIKTNTLSSSLYILKVMTSKGEFSKKIIITK